MKKFTVMVLSLMMFLAVMLGLDFRNSRAQSSSGEQSAAKLPPDVHPDTLSRMPRPKREDFTSEEDKQIFDRVVATQPSIKDKTGVLGPTGMRATVPAFGEEYRKLGRLVHTKNSLDPKMVELVSMVAVREADTPAEWGGHAMNGIKLLGPKVVEVIAYEEDTAGLDEKVALVINFGRQLFHQRRVSSRTFADMERTFGRNDTLDITLLMGYYLQNTLIYRAYDQRPEPDNPALVGKVPIWW
jgi:hypothetical protein